MGWLHQLLLPRTDAGVGAQVGLLALLVIAGLVKTWHDPDLRRLVIGAGMFVLGLMGLRAAH
jgi:hypothetical protein